MTTGSRWIMPLYVLGFVIMPLSLPNIADASKWQLPVL